VRTILDALGVEYVEQERLIGYWPDFLIPSKNLIIECDGKYWHEMPGRAEHDELRDRKLRGLGYTVVRLSEESINSDAHSAVGAALALVA
jgi:very-short-patch-repair endonuclease